MKCELCGAAEARIFIQQTSTSGRTTLRLCLECARQRGLSRLDGDLSQSVRELLASTGGTALAGGKPMRCSRCGSNLAELRKRGAAGCPVCWERFGTALLGDRPTVPYRGQLPARLVGSIRKSDAAGDLRRRLNEALAAEDYESAARWRDRLRALENPDQTHA